MKCWSLDRAPICGASRAVGGTLSPASPNFSLDALYPALEVESAATRVPFESRDITAKKKPHCWGLISRWWTVGDSNPGPWD